VVVADPLQVGHQVGGEHDADLLSGSELQQALQELAPSQRVEAGYRLIQDQQLRPLAMAMASWARSPPDSFPAR
jgi:hypothetical protein